jgi:hypothetical protein
MPLLPDAAPRVDRSGSPYSADPKSARPRTLFAAIAATAAVAAGSTTGVATASPTVAAVTQSGKDCLPALRELADHEASAFLGSADFPDDALRLDADSSVMKLDPTNATVLYVAGACASPSRLPLPEADSVNGGPATRYVLASAESSLPVAAPLATEAPLRQGDIACAFGHDGPVVHGTDVGAWFLDQLATTDEPLADAYFRAVRRVHPLSEPAVRCFGTDVAAARMRLTTSRRFLEERPGKGGSAWMTETGRRIEAATPQAASAAPRSLMINRRNLPAAQLARMLLGAGARDDSFVAGDPTAALQVFRTDVGTMTYETASGRLAWQQTPRTVAGDEGVPDLTTSIQLARAFIARKELLTGTEQSLQPAWLVERRLGDDSAAPLVISRTVVFAQRLGVTGIESLGSGGTVEVTVGARGEVTAMTASLLDASAAATATNTIVSPTAVEAAAGKAVAEINAKLPGTKVAILATRIGYESGDAAALSAEPKAAALAVEVLLEAIVGESHHRYAFVEAL